MRKKKKKERIQTLQILLQSVNKIPVVFICSVCFYWFDCYALLKLMTSEKVGCKFLIYTLPVRQKKATKKKKQRVVGFSITVTDKHTPPHWLPLVFQAQPGPQKKPKRINSFHELLSKMTTSKDTPPLPRCTKVNIKSNNWICFLSRHHQGTSKEGE